MRLSVIAANSLFNFFKTDLQEFIQEMSLADLQWAAKEQLDKNGMEVLNE